MPAVAVGVRVATRGANLSVGGLAFVVSVIFLGTWVFLREKVHVQR